MEESRARLQGTERPLRQEVHRVPEFYADELNAGGNVVEPNEPIVPVEPHKLVLLVQDITSQKLMHHGAQQPRGLLAHMDEMNGWAGL